MTVILDIIAPWIVDSWLDTFGAFAFSLPTVEIERDLAVCVFAGIVAVLVAFAQISIRHLPRQARRAALLTLLPIMLLPVVAAGDTRYGLAARIQVQRITTALLHGAQASARRQMVRVTPRQDVAVVQRPAVAEPAVPAPAVVQRSAEPVTLPGVPPPLPAPVMEKPSTAQSATNAIARVASLLARSALPKSDVRVIPVLYGTDRAAERARAGLDYTAARAGRLALGRVLVTEPEAGRGGSDGRAGIFEIKELSPDEVRSAARLEASSARHSNGRALVYVHGLNMSFKAAVLEAVRIAEAARFDGAVLLYSWPSAGQAVQYAYDVQSAAEARPHLTDFLSFVLRQTGASSISIVADGLGGSAVIDALGGLADMKQHGEALPAEIGDLVLRALDMDQARFVAKVSEIRPLVGKVTLYATASDRSLNVSRRYVGAAPRAGDVSDGGPMVLDGVETVDVTEPPFDPREPRARAGIPAAFAALGRRLGGGGEAAGSGQLEVVQSARGAYWRLKANP